MKTQFLALYLISILFFGCISTQQNSNEKENTESSIAPIFSVQFDDSGNPINTGNNYVIDVSELNPDSKLNPYSTGYFHLHNTSSSPIAAYYYDYNNSSWQILWSSIKPNDSRLLEATHYRDGFRYGLLGFTYLGEDIAQHELYYEKGGNIFFGYPKPVWKGDSYKTILQNIFSEIDRPETKPILVENLITYKPNSAGGVDVKIDFWNNSQHTIKYVYFDVTPYNRVGDKTKSEIRGKSLLSLQVTDFIEPYKKYTAQWENVWYNSTIAFCKIEAIRIIYSDNSEKKIIDKSEIENILNVNPIKKVFFDNEEIQVGLSYENQSAKCYAQSEKIIEELFVYFNTESKTLYSEGKKNISITFNELEKVKSNNNTNYYEESYAHSSNELLYETNEIKIKYKLKGEEPKEFQINDLGTRTSIADFAYLIENLGLR